MNALLSLGGWSIIPDLATRYTLQFIYTTPLVHRTLRLTPSAPNTPTYRRHYGITFAVVVLGYLLYTLIEKAVNAPENFYETLGVGPGVDEGGLKVAFRQFAKRYHPDRVGKGGEEKFMEVRKLVDALKNPAVRFAYDRFGPDVLKWKGQCTTTGEYLWHGLMQSAGYHIAGLAFLLFWSAVGRSTPFTFWRYILYFTLLSLELRLILSPSPSPSGRHITLLHRLFPNRVIYQHILFLHQVFMFLNVALMRVTPHLIGQDEMDNPRVEAALVERTMALVNLADRETSKLVHIELQSISHPTPSSPSPSPSSSSPPPPSTHYDIGFSPTPHRPSFARPEPVTPAAATTLLNELAPEVEALIIENNLKQNAGPLKTAWEAAVRRVWGRRVEEVREAEARGREQGEPFREGGEGEGVEERGREGEEEEDREGEQRRDADMDRERTPTPTSPVPLPPVSANPLTPAPSMGYVGVGQAQDEVVVRVKQEEEEGDVPLPLLPKSPSPGRSLPPAVFPYSSIILPSSSNANASFPSTIFPSTPTHPPKTPPARSPFRSLSARFNSTTTMPFSSFQPSSPSGSASGIVPANSNPYLHGMNGTAGVNGTNGTTSHTPRSMLRSVPRTPGDLPSPRPSPSPPPPGSPSSPFPSSRRGGGVGVVGGGGYFAKGTAMGAGVGMGMGTTDGEEGEEGEGEWGSVDRIRARSLSC